MQSEIKNILEAVKDGSISVDDALLKIKTEPFRDIGYANVDLHREVRQGRPEVIYGAGKTLEQIMGIIDVMLETKQKTILVTRLKAEYVEPLASKYSNFTFHRDAGIGVIGSMPRHSGLGKVAVITAGTSDIPVAEEAALTAEAMGSEVLRLYDVGVAGLHRLLSRMDAIMSASVIVAVAGMEGALASVIGGLVDCPVIAVPTSVGYGASFHGVAALLSMLNSCANGISVVNIDNGFGAGYLANMINHMEGKK